MSKNTQISELINYLSFDGSGNIFFNTVSAAGSETGKILVSDNGTVKYRTPLELLAEIGAVDTTTSQTIAGVKTFSGNVGIGVTPSAWGSLFVVSQYPYGTYFGGTTSGGSVMGNNNYYNGTSYIYQNSDYATQYQQASGTHFWRLAPSGTAGNAISFTQAMTLNASGNLGIGVSPSYKLHLLGGNEVGSRFIVTGTYAPIQFSGDNSTTLGAINAYAGNVVIGGGTATGVIGSLSISTSTGAASFSSTLGTQGSISINNGGGLFATGDVFTTGGRLLVSNGSQSASAETGSILLGNRGYFTTSDIGAARISAIAIGANWYSGTGLAFYTNPGPDVTSTSAIERLRITSGGRVLINSTTVSDGKLAIDTATSTAYNPTAYNGTNANIRLTNGSAGVNRYTGISFGGGGATEAFIGSVQNSSNLAEIVFQTYNGSAYGERMRISSGGLATFNGNIHLYAGATNHTLQFGTSSNWWYRFESSADDFIIRDANDTLIKFDHSSADTYFVDSVALVTGQLNSKSLAGGGQSMYLNYQGNGGIYAGSSYAVIWSGSDERIKSNIQDVNPTLEKVLALRSRKFKYKERPDHTNYGFIAQEVEQVMPEIVRTSEGITMCGDEEIVDQKSIETYGPAWAAILVKAIQEQQTIIEDLKARIEILEG